MENVILSKQAAKVLGRMPRNTADLIRSKVSQLAQDPDAQANNVKWIAAFGCYRLRVGDWRVFFDRDGNILNILAIRPRGNAYQ
ncbi:type II toxin-antitoxin system RelE family toxin [Tsuneonella suprasediminis]|uniref:type II toxin-antitoxin system RelE family toxin n=1 Tax=Tsuneonella suprasediminis TaxID=2306996 RepID=UPI002F953C31